MKLSRQTPPATINSRAVLKSAVLLSALVSLISGCAALTENPYALPVVSNPAATATVMVKSADNASPVQFIHLLNVNGSTAMKLAAGDKGSFPIDEGKHQFKVTCHVVPKADTGRPTNLHTIDGVSEIEADLKAGDEICLKITKPLLTCVKVEDLALSQCR